MLTSTSAKKPDFEHLSAFRYKLGVFLNTSTSLCQMHELTPLQYQLLLHVMGAAEKQWLDIGELAEKLQAKPRSVLLLADRCEKLQLVRLKTDPQDRQRSEVHLLPKGWQLINQLAELHRQAFQPLEDIFNAPACNKLCTSPVCWKGAD